MVSGAPINVLDYGAVGTGLVDDRAAIQAAIDYANSLGKPVQVLLPAGFTFSINVGTYVGVIAGVIGIVLKDNVTLVINGTLKAQNQIYGPGTLSSLIGTLDVGVSNAKITGTGTVDGNRDNQTTSVQCDSIHLRCVYQVKVDGIRVINSNGNGILLTKPPAGANHDTSAIVNCSVTGCNTIGIQVSHSAVNLLISGNQVTSCVNNCIDVYHENGTTAPDAGVISITGNTVSGGLVGIFPETTANCSVIGNAISSCTYAGIATNRVNGAPANIVISGNNIRACPTGIIGSGDTKGVLICTNTISGFTSSGIELQGLTVASYVVQGNLLIPNTTTTPIISLNGTTFVWNQIVNNTCADPSHNQAYGIVYTGVATFSSSSTIEPIIYNNQIRPVKNVGIGSTSSGGTLVITAPAQSAGKLLIKSSSSGSWNSVWSGSFTASTRVAVAQESSTFTTPGNNVASVVGSATTTDITVTWAATGSGGNYQYWIEYI